MNITNKTVLITGANRGIGKALVDEALRRGAKKVYAGMRSPVQHSDKRVTPLVLDVTNASQIQRAVGARLADQGITVHAVVIGPVDTDMNRGFEIPKAPPETAAAGIFDGLEKGEEEIFPDPVSHSIAEGWRNGVSKALEREFRAFVPAAAARAE